jgi:hypothetical protein
VEQEHPNVDKALASVGHHRGVLADRCAATERLASSCCPLLREQDFTHA